MEACCYEEVPEEVPDDQRVIVLGLYLGVSIIGTVAIIWTLSQDNTSTTP